jgi:4-amino-4-deoxy-L-arabinose transferase-like glycosyltransferase
MSAEATSARRQDGIGRMLVLVLGAASALAVLNLALTVAARVGSPYPLEWMEGTSLEHALRLLRGAPIYAAPSGEHIAYLYPPLAYVPMAALAALFGPSLPVARAASLACLLATLALLYRAGARAGGSRTAGAIAAASFACGFGYTGGFMDLVRVDACFVALLALALERLLHGKLGTALACLAASALAKQHGAVLLALVSLACLLDDRRRQARAVALAWLGLGASGAWLQLQSDGYFARYVLELPAAHGLDPRLLVSFLPIDLGVYLPVLTLATLWVLPRRQLARPVLALLLGAVAVSALGRAHEGGDDNVRLPAFLVLCVLGTAPLVARALDARAARNGRVLAALLLLVQLGVLHQPPAAHAPSARTQQRFAELSRALSRCAAGGRSAALDYGRLGSAPVAHTMALSDVRLGGPSPLASAATRAVLDSLAGTAAPAALAVGERFAALDRVLEQHYQECAVLPAPRPPTGYAPGELRAGSLRQIVYARRGSAR